MSKVIIITANYRGRKIERRAYSDFQAFTIINTLSREGCVDIGMREETKSPQYNNVISCTFVHLKS